MKANATKSIIESPTNFIYFESKTQKLKCPEVDLLNENLTKNQSFPWYSLIARFLALFIKNSS